MVQASVCGDPIKPGADRRATLKSFETHPGSEQRVLQYVFGVLQRRQHAVAVHLQFSPVRVDEFGEGFTVPTSRSPKEVSGCLVVHLRPSLDVMGRAATRRADAVDDDVDEQV